MFTIYLVLMAVLMANLLIAIITYKYKPDEVHAVTCYNLALVIDQHHFQV